ncbi:pentapeptide repeat-containing protein [Hyphomonas jannaschiana]|uniref:pentapeptide repeat-containing protein n=1 Tax=Hyphomonas jannaschiana TaxID=86 RepID=UPI0035C75797
MVFNDSELPKKWQQQDFSWDGKSIYGALLDTKKFGVSVPPSFPDGVDNDGTRKTVSLKDYWRWSIGLDGEERLLSDSELENLGLLVEVGGTRYHLIHAPHFDKKSSHLLAIVKARLDIAKPQSGSDAPSTEATPLRLDGSWVHTQLSSLLGGGADIEATYAVFNTIVFGEDVGVFNAQSATFFGLARSLPFHIFEAAVFKDAVFMQNTEFSTCKFTGEVNFDGAEFRKEADFSRVRFCGRANFNGARFSQDANFNSAIFRDRARFYSASFSRNADFSYSKFQSDADFTYTKGNGDFSCSGAEFSKLAWFPSSVFAGRSFFYESTFEDAVSFASSTFSGVFDFSSATLKGEVYFADASFEKMALFTDVRWPSKSIDNAFRNARFQERADFTCDNFHSISSLNEVKFDIEPIFSEPTERGAQDAIFKRAVKSTKESISFDERMRREFKKDRLVYDGAKPDDRWAALSGGYRTLKNVAERNGDFLLVQTYYRFEIKTRVKRPRIPFWEKVAAAFYGVSSDYGNSIARPFASLGIMLVTFALVYLALAVHVGLVPLKDGQSLKDAYLESLDFSLKNVFRPLSALSTDPPKEGDTSRLAGKLINNYGIGFGLIVTSISIVQSLIGIALAFLFGLAVRRRFQIE